MSIKRDQDGDGLVRSISHPQDDLLIVKALYHHGREIEDSHPDRTNRAW